MDDEGYLHRSVAEAEVDCGLYGSGVVHHLVAYGASRVGVDYIYLVALELVPAQIGRVGTPRVVLCRGRVCTE